MRRTVVALPRREKNLRFIPVRLAPGHLGPMPDALGPTCACIAGRHVTEVCPPESISVMKIKNKIVPAPTRVRFPVDFESVVSRKTHNALIGPGSCENVLVLRKSE
jgi:hypothetical protein